MSFVVWIVLGLAAGFTAGRLTNQTGTGNLPDVLLGLIGALAGGWLSYAFGPVSVNGLNMLSLYAAFFSSVAVLLVYHGIRRW
jgi:uncharacterized membrane protein YeaQ/YmgE (transglycosylase-associated protein family)